MLRAVRDHGAALDWTVVDIADDDALFERYGWFIPVLRAPSAGELRWPFDVAALQAFVQCESGA